MRSAPLTDNEARRLGVLFSLGILDTPPEERFDRITRDATRQLKAPISLIVFLDDYRQWFKSHQGVSIRETSRDVAFCAHAILDDGLFVIPDASSDVRFHDNPLVTGPPEIRFFAGYPIRAKTGEPLGNLCVIDRVPRVIDSKSEEQLVSLARQVTAELQRPDPVERDPDTQMLTRTAFLQQGADALADNYAASDNAWTLFVLRLTPYVHNVKIHSKRISAGTAQAYAKTLNAAFGRSALYGRVGPNTFSVLVPDKDAMLARRGTRNLLTPTTNMKRQPDDPIATTIADVGYVHSADGSTEDMNELLIDASAEAFLASKLRSIVGSNDQSEQQKELLSSMLRNSRTLGSLFPFVRWDTELPKSSAEKGELGDSLSRLNTFTFSPSVLYWYLLSSRDKRNAIVERVEQIAEGFALDGVEGEEISLKDISDIVEPDK